MDYRFTMTTRMIALSVVSVLLLLGLLFALGFQIGQQWASEEALKRPAATGYRPAPLLGSPAQAPSPAPVTAAVPSTNATPPSAPAAATPVAATPR
jgi:hypothetical protein